MKILVSKSDNSGTGTFFGFAKFAIQRRRVGEWGQSGFKPYIQSESGVKLDIQSESESSLKSWSSLIF